MTLRISKQRRALLLAAFSIFITIPSSAQSGSWYSLRSRCNFEFRRNGATALVIVEGKPCNAIVEPMKYSQGAYTLSCNGHETFSYMIDEGQVIILNDKYQHGCETAKAILMNATDDADAPEAFRTYIADHDYILDDTASMLAKGRYLNGRSRFRFTVILLEAFLAKHPESADAHLHLADAFHGLKDVGNAQQNYRQYRRIYSLQHSGAEAPASRTF